MRRVWFLLVLVLLLTACGSVPVFETVGDQWQEVPPVREPREVLLELPGGVAVPTMETEDGQRVYICDGYEISVQIQRSGNLAETVRAVTGCEMDALTVLDRVENGFRRHDLAWSAAGENGDRVGRAAILDDGCYHYAVCVLADADRAKDAEQAIQTVLCNIALGV